MRSVADWLGEYGESHANPTNKLLHWTCVPLIVLAVMGLLWSIPVPAAFAALFAVLNALDSLPWPLWATSLTIFVVAWIGQLIGHAVEGKRPSFFKDVQFLLIGPLWLIAALYRRLGVSY